MLYENIESCLGIHQMIEIICVVDGYMITFTDREKTIVNIEAESVSECMDMLEKSLVGLARE